jgi:3-dehydroquinate synthase
VSDQITVHVGLSHAPYDITIYSRDDGSAQAADATKVVEGVLAALQPLTHLLVITDENVRSPHAERLATQARQQIERVDVISVPAGESTKCAAQLEQLWQQLLELGADRQTVVAAVGGGVVGDLAGFVAASFARGIRFIQVPTTLLAHVDSSVGGKVGINLPGAKNMVGAFWQPAAVLIDTATLSTLPEREYLSGLAEVVKYGVIMDEPFFEFLEQNVDAIMRREASVLRKLVARCCELKAEVVQEDETETTGRRAILNYGHTFAHGFEAVGGYGTLLHGEAVSIGMVCASRLAESRDMVPAGFTDRQVELLRAFALPTETPEYDAQVLLAAMQRDKKAAHGKLRFILPEGSMGKMVFVSDIPDEQVLDALH